MKSITIRIFLIFMIWVIPFCPSVDQQMPELMGVDEFGRNVFHRLYLSLASSVAIDVSAAMVAVLTALSIAMLSLSVPRMLKQSILVVINTVDSMPRLLLLLVFTMSVQRVQNTNDDKSLFTLWLSLILLSCFRLTRIIRVRILEMLNSGHINAARALGVSRFRLFRTHMWPELKPWVGQLILWQFALNLALETQLGFLGLGLTSTPTFGYFMYRAWHRLAQNPHEFLISTLVVTLLLTWAQSWTGSPSVYRRVANETNSRG